MWPFKKKEKDLCFHKKGTECCSWKIRPSFNYFKFNSKIDPESEFPGPIICIGISQYITKFQGEIKGYPTEIANIGIQIRPLAWRFGQDHIYYDGKHCLYKFGPIWFENSWGGNCNKCWPEENNCCGI